MQCTLPEVQVTAVCHDCRRQHTYRLPVADLARAMGEWEAKHAGHPVAYSSPVPVYTGPWRKWLHQFWNDCPLWAPAAFPLGHGYAHNADVKAAYVATGTYVITLASLATSSTRVAGRQSDAVSNTSGKYLDYLVGGKITAGTSPTVSKQADIWAGFAVNDTPLYPDTLTGAGDAAKTLTSENVRNGGLVPLRSLVIDNTSDRTYWMAPVSLATALGALAPMGAHVLFVAHDHAVALNATGGNHAFYNTGLYGTVA